MRDQINTPHPMTIGASPLQWIDFADDSTVTTDTGGISAVKDKSGSGHHLEQTNSTYQPDHEDGWADCDGTEYFDMAPPLVDGQAEYTVLLTWRLRQVSSVYQVGWEQFSDPEVTGRRTSLLARSNGYFGFSGFGKDYAPFITPLNVSFIAGIRKTGDVVRVYNNLDTSDITLTGLNCSSDTGAVGARSTGGEPCDGLIGDILVYEDSLEDHQVQNLITYLINKRGITI